MKKTVRVWDMDSWIGLGLLAIFFTLGVGIGIGVTQGLAGRSVANAEAKARVAVAERDKAVKETLFCRMTLRRIVEGDTAQGMVRGRVSEGD